MKQSTTVLTQKRRGPKPTGKGSLIGVRLQPDMLEKIDALRAKHDPMPSRPEAIRQVLEATFRDDEGLTDQMETRIIKKVGK